MVFIAPLLTLTPQDFEKMLFSGPGSQMYTIEGYYNECSRGRAASNRTNSMVVGPVPIPCQYSGETELGC